MLEQKHQNERECTCCARLKPIEEFYSKGSRYDASCKECVKEKKKEKRRKKRVRRVGIRQVAFDQCRISVSAYQGPAPTLDEIGKLLHEFAWEVLSRGKKSPTTGRSHAR